MARGETPDDAARIARTEFNGARLEALLGTLRLAHWGETPPPGPSRAFSLDSLRIDLRHTLRALRATPSFTIGALLVLALGTAPRPQSSPSSTRWCFVRCRFRTPIASSLWGSEGTPTRVVSADRQVARQAPDRWAVGQSQADRRNARRQTGRPGRAWENRATELSRLGGTTARVRVDRSRGRRREYTLPTARRRTTDRRWPPGDGGLLRGAASQPMLGEVFTSRHEVAGSDRVVVLSHAFWRRELGGDRSVVGRMLPLNGESYEVVGVMPPGFTYPVGAIQPAETWVPYVPTPSERVRGRGRSIYLQSIARLKPGVSIAQAQAHMSLVLRRWPPPTRRLTRGAASASVRCGITSSVRPRYRAC